MAKLFNKINKGFKRLFRISLFLISAILIIYFFPKSGKFKYSFENGRPWQSENLYAPFDFAIKKSDSEINKEIENAKLVSPVFFSQDTSVFLKSVRSNIYIKDSFLNDSILANYSNKLKKRILEQSILVLNDIYSVGFIEENYDFKESQKVSILNDNRLVKKTSFSSLIKPENLLFYVNNQIIANNYEKYSSQIISIIFEVIKPNLILNERLTNESYEESISNISPNRGFVEKETLIISKGEVIEGEKLVILNSLKQEYEVNDKLFSDYYLILLAYSLLVILSLLMIVLFIRKFERDIYENNNKIGKNRTARTGGRALE